MIHLINLIIFKWFFFTRLNSVLVRLYGCKVRTGQLKFLVKYNRKETTPRLKELGKVYLHISQRRKTLRPLQQKKSRFNSKAAVSPVHQKEWKYQLVKKRRTATGAIDLKYKLTIFNMLTSKSVQEDKAISKN